MKRYFIFVFMFFLFLYESKNLAMTQSSDGVELIRFLFTENYAVDQVIENLSRQDCSLGQEFEKIYNKDVNFVDLKFLNSYLNKGFDLGKFFKNNSPDVKIKSILAPLVLHDLHKNKELSENIYQLFQDLVTKDSSKEITYINAYDITFGKRYAGNTVYKEKYDEYQQFFELQKEKEREKDNLINNLTIIRKNKSKDQGNSFAIEITITHRVKNRSEAKKNIKKPINNDLVRICEHLKITGDDINIFACVIERIKDECGQKGCLLEEIYNHYEKNKFNFLSLLNCAEAKYKDGDFVQVKKILAPILLYDFLYSNNYEDLNKDKKNFLKTLYFGEIKNNNKLPKIDGLYKRIYESGDEDLKNIWILRCYYQIKINNRKESGSSNHKKNLEFLESVKMFGFSDRLTSFSWIDQKNINSCLQNYLEILVKFDQNTAANDFFCALFTNNKYDIFKDQKIIGEYFSFIIHFFTKTDNTDLNLTDSETKKLILYLDLQPDKTIEFLDGCQGKYQKIFAQIFITYFSFDWLLQNNQEARKYYLEKLRYFNTLNSKEKRKVKESKVINLFSEQSFLVLYQLFAEDKDNDFVYFIENNIEYEESPLEIIQIHRDNFDQKFLDACQNVGFIDKKTQFLGDNENFIPNQNNNQNQNISIDVDNNTINNGNFGILDIHELTEQEVVRMAIETSVKHNEDYILENVIKKSLDEQQIDIKNISIDNDLQNIISSCSKKIISITDLAFFVIHSIPPGQPH